MLASARHVQAVLAGRSLPDSLAQTPPALRAAAQAVSFHVMRRLGLARELRRLMVKRPPADPLLDALMLVALALLTTALATDNKTNTEAGDAPPHTPPPPTPREPVYAIHTVVDQAVRAAQGMPAYKSLLNACLRRCVREHDALNAQALTQIEARWNFPAWWVQALREAWPDDWQALLAHANQPAPMTLRVNRRQMSIEALSAALTQAGIAHDVSTPASTPDAACTALTLARPCPVSQIPGFAQGWWSVQDASAQLAAHWLAPVDGERVLDACAAPGGKTTHLLELADIQLLALDNDAPRLARVQQNLDRLQLNQRNVTLQCADAAVLDDWWDGQPFDAVLADVPCTASGVVRRHPDIRWLKQADDVARTAAQQQRLVDALWQTVKPGGRLLYASCSIFPQEGEMQAQRFAATHADARRLPAPGQILPVPDASGHLPGDGFFYALFVKANADTDIHADGGTS